MRTLTNKGLALVGMVLLSVFVIAGTSSAAGPEADYKRPGWFVGVGGGLAVDFLSEAVEDVTGGVVELTDGGTFNARIGYRLNSWFAVEGMYEGMWGIGTKVLDVKVGESSYNGIFGNLKFILPTWRLHPYFALGFGGQQGEFSSDFLDVDRWDFAMRFPLGLDGYITENWVLNLELAPTIRFTDWGEIPSEATDNVTLTFSVGVQYRF